MIIFPLQVIILTKMQLIPPQPVNYLPLITILPLAFSNTPPIHIFLFATLLLIRPNVTQNYCNAIISVLISLFLLLHNFYLASSVIFQYSSSSFLKMHNNVFLSATVWLYIIQATFLILWTQFCYRKYKEYKSQSLI